MSLSNNSEHIVIIGNGIAGTTAARHIRKKSDKKITIISSESKHFYSRTALMYIFMGHMKYEHTKPYEDHFWSKNKINLVFDHVEDIKVDSKTLILKKNSPFQYDKLIIATGSKPRRIGIKGEKLKGVQGLYSLQDLDTLENNIENCNEAVVAGGGLIGIELVEMLLSRGVKTNFLVRESNFWGNILSKDEAKLIEAEIQRHGVNLILEDEINEITGDNYVINTLTNKGKVIDCQFIGITIGVQPNIQFIENKSIEINRGILVNNHLETSLKDIYAIGDCAEIRTPNVNRRSIEQVWYTGRMMGETVAKTICGNPSEYLPGIWFNSAKFFDIEYQTYGLLKTQETNDEKHFFWQHNDRTALRFAFDAQTYAIKGVNSFGIRLRHELFDKWISEKQTIQFVLSNLKSANFDPELYTTFEKDIINQFNSKFNENVVLNSKKWWQKLTKSSINA